MDRIDEAKDGLLKSSYRFLTGSISLFGILLYIFIYKYITKTFEVIQAQLNKKVLLMFIIVALNINSILNTCDKPLNENTYIPKSKQWTRCKHMKKWLVNKLILIEQQSRSWGKPRRYLCKSKTYHRKNKGTKKVQTSAIIMTAVIVMQAKYGHTNAHTVIFDTDTHPIGVDNRCTVCISHVADDFVGPSHD